MIVYCAVKKEVERSDWPCRRRRDQLSDELSDDQLRFTCLAQSR